MIGACAAISRILSKAACQSGYSLLRTDLLIRIKELQKGIELMAGLSGYKTKIKKANSLIRVLRGFYDRLNVTKPSFTKKDYMWLA